MAVTSLIAFTVFTLLCLAVLLIINRRRKILLTREFARIRESLAEEGYGFSCATSFEPVQLKTVYFPQYVQAYSEFYLHGYHGSLSVAIFVAEFSGNFAQSDSATKLCVYIDGRSPASGKFEISSLNNRVYWGSQRKLPRDVKLPPEL